MEDKKKRLQPIYDDFASLAEPFTAEAACSKGCAFCCSAAGSIDITTLEGLVIRECIARLPRGRQVAVKQLLSGATYARRGSTSSREARFLREARVTGSLEHPNIVPVHELGVRADGSTASPVMTLKNGSVVDIATARKAKDAA